MVQHMGLFVVVMLHPPLPIYHSCDSSLVFIQCISIFICDITHQLVTWCWRPWEVLQVAQ